jgi:hypothetical protein
VEFWRKKATKYMDNLDDADAPCHRLEDRIRELEDELAGPRKYEDRRGNKRAQYDLSNGTGSGVASPARLVPVKEMAAPPVRRDDGRVQVVPTVHVEEDMQMEDREVSFPPLPTPVPPMAEAIQAPHFQHGANWTPAPVPRGAPVVCGSPFGRPMPRYAGLVIASVEELEQHLEAVNMP